jgi:hypothetical protein
MQHAIFDGADGTLVIAAISSRLQPIWYARIRVDRCSKGIVSSPRRSESAVSASFIQIEIRERQQ